MTKHFLPERRRLAELESAARTLLDIIDAGDRACESDDWIELDNHVQRYDAARDKLRELVG